MTTLASTNAVSVSGTTATRSRAVLAVLTVIFGVSLYVGTGFAAPALLHNAAHDARHALGLPCH